MTAQYNDTRCQGIIIEGTVGEVQITKMNSKSFHFEGEVSVLNSSNVITKKGTAVFWKVSKDKTKTYYKYMSAVLTVNN